MIYMFLCNVYIGPTKNHNFWSKFENNEILCKIDGKIVNPTQNQIKNVNESTTVCNCVFKENEILFTVNVDLIKFLFKYKLEEVCQPVALCDDFYLDFLKNLQDFFFYDYLL